MPCRLAVVMLAVASLSFAGCDASHPTRPSVTLPGGLVYRDIVIGTGAVADTGMMLTVHYTVMLQNGKKVDSSYDRGQPFQFMLGTGQVIAGWDLGIPGMRVGGRRLLIIPPELAYGATGSGNLIPPNATILSDVTLLGVEAAPPKTATAAARPVVR